jgi:hypothetical protein
VTDDYSPSWILYETVGRTQRDKDRLPEAITEDAVNILKVEKKDVIVVFQETPWKLVCFWSPSSVIVIKIQFTTTE